MTDQPSSEVPAIGMASVPRATYRLQFHAGFRFEEATGLVGYLAALGISHLYASSYLRARSGSLHGYDIVDHNEINPEIGSEADFGRLCNELRSHSMSQILDVVPNHMGVLQGDNPWWVDVTENGRASPWANTFDIDWEPSGSNLNGQVLLAILGSQYGHALENGELRLRYDTEVCGFRVHYFEHAVPVDPRTYPSIFATVALPQGVSREESEQLAAAITAFASLQPRDETIATNLSDQHRLQSRCKQDVARLRQSVPWIEKWLDACAESFTGTKGCASSFDPLDHLIGIQPWRLAYWRVAADEVNYRRFFEVSSLAGVQMERADVFSPTHRTILRWLKEGKLTGLRIDHPDGLAEPSQYFERLQLAFARGQRENGDDARSLYIAIEKILANHEHWPDEWLVHGDTGYRFSNLVNGIFVDERAVDAFDRLYAQFIGELPDYESELLAAKRYVIFHLLPSDLHLLVEAAYRIAQESRLTRDYTRNGLRSALVELAAGMPVYRTYVGEGGVHEMDRSHLRWAASAAQRNAALTEDATLDFLVDVMTNESKLSEARLKFVRRFQQFTSPVMAKAMEDTAFYRYHRLVSLNDVGGDPKTFGISVAAFHGANRARSQYLPHCMLATSTHDSKRSEDVRTRLDVLSEMPEAWALALQRWRQLRLRQSSLSTVGVEIKPNDEFLLYQTLVGIWPLADVKPETLETIRTRVQAYMLKAMREAKQTTSWLRPDADYERSVACVIDALLGRVDANPFLSDLTEFVSGVAPFGYANSLTLVAVKLTAPGVPDIYQGCETWNDSLVDPDNRRAVDFTRVKAQLAELQSAWSEHNGLSEPMLDTLRQNIADGRLKLLVTWRLLALRSTNPELFERGDYVPLSINGAGADHLVAFARTTTGAAAARTVTIGTRLLYTFFRTGGSSPFSGTCETPWAGTEVNLPEGSGGKWRNVLTGKSVKVHCSEKRCWLNASDVLGDLPVAQICSAED